MMECCRTLLSQIRSLVKSGEILETPWYFSYFQMRKVRLRKKVWLHEGLAVDSWSTLLLPVSGEIEAEVAARHCFPALRFDTYLMGLREPPGTGLLGH